MKKDWTYKKLGEIADFFRGLTYGKNDEAEFSDVCVLRSNNIDMESMSLNFDEIKYLRPDFKIPEDKKIKANSIFICMSNGSKQHVGKVAYIERDMDYAFGGFMGLITPYKTVSSKFVYYVCCSSLYRSFLASIGNGIGITNLKFTDLSNFSFPLPELQEQQQVVAELDLLSAMIEKQKAQIEELDKLSQSFFYDMFGDPVTNEKGWEVKNLKDIAVKIGSGATPRGGNQSYKDEGISLIRSMNVHNNVFVYDDLAFIDDEQATQLNNVIVEANDVLLNITGASVARCCIVPDDVLPARVNQHVCIIRPNTDLTNSIYLNRFFTSIEEQSVLLLLSRSNAATREALPKNLLENCRIVLPPLSLQQEFAAKIEAIEAMKAKVRQSLKESETLFNSRMDYYFN